MKTIKFRAWDTKNKMMLVPEKVDFCVAPHGAGACDWERDILIQQKHLIIEQFIGLYDRNGKDIYEGDILNWYTTEGTTNGLKMTVTYFDDRAMWGIVFGNGFDTFETYMEFGDIGKQFEIIGNIHEDKI